MGSESPRQFNQKRGLKICAKGDNAQNRSGADHTVHQVALARESGIGKWHTSRSLLGTRLTTLHPRLLVGSPVLGSCGDPLSAHRLPETDPLPDFRATCFPRAEILG